MQCLPCTGGGSTCDRRLDISNEGKQILVPVFTSVANTAIEESEKDLIKRARGATLAPNSPIYSCYVFAVSGCGHYAVSSLMCSHCPGSFSFV